MNNEFKISDPETRARDIANLRAACRQLDLTNLLLDEAIAVADAHLLGQRSARLRSESNYLPTQSES